MNSCIFHHDESQERQSQQIQSPENLHANQKKTLVDEFFQENIDCVNDSEVDKYINFPIVLHQMEEREFDVCRWWFINKEHFPTLFKLSNKYLAIPASSSTSERIFSVSKYLISAQRSNLLPSTVNNIMFLKSTYENDQK